MAVVAELKKISKTFRVGDEVVIAADGVDLAVREGELACVYGASGSGKTTILNILAGIESPDSGSVVIEGRPLGRSEGERAATRLNKIGVVFQSNNLLAEFTARENVALPLMARRMSRHDVDASVERALTSVGLLGLADRLPSRMSGGQRQRVGIARALAGDQRLLLADEPTGALDSQNSLQLFALLRSLCDEHGTAIVLATHDPLAGAFASTAHQMVDGRITDDVPAP